MIVKIYRIDLQWKLIPRSQSAGSRSKYTSYVEPRSQYATWYMEFVYTSQTPCAWIWRLQQPEFMWLLSRNVWWTDFVGIWFVWIPVPVLDPQSVLVRWEITVFQACIVMSVRTGSMFLRITQNGETVQILCSASRTLVRWQAPVLLSFFPFSFVTVLSVAVLCTTDVMTSHARLKWTSHPHCVTHIS